MAENTATTIPRRPLAAAVIAAAAVAFARPASSAIVTIGRPQDGGADAELIALCERHAINFHAFNDHGDLDDADDPYRAAYIATRDAISDAKPQTLAGMAAKAQASKVEASQPDGSEEHADCSAGDWAWDLVNDLVRLGGRA